MQQNVLVSVSALLLLAGCNYDGLGTPPADNGREELTVVPDRAEAVCNTLDLADVRPPAWALEPDIGCDRRRETYCFRLSDALREIAAAHDPQRALEASAMAFEDHLRDDDPVALERARAFADLAVTGTAAYDAFVSAPPTASDLDSVDDEAAELAVARAYETLWALRGPPSHRAEARAALGWIAISPEDDLPARPVNVASTPNTQSDLAVDVDVEDGTTLTLRARMTVATTEAVPEASVPDVLVGALPSLDTPTLPEAGDVMLYIHGHSSRAEESDTLSAELLRIAREAGRALTIISVDLPGGGYTERVDPAELMATADASLGQDVFLRFIEAFVVSFVETLDRAQPGLSDRIAAVMGGSLGGNMTLRLAERADELGWVRRAIAWSPVSIDYSWTRAQLLGGGDEGFTDIVKHEAVRRTNHESLEFEDRGARSRYFVDGVMSVRKQSEYWYREGWACGPILAGTGLHQLAEIYDSRFRRSHYRLAYEQLVFSHLETMPSTGEARFESLAAPLLLIAGREDNAIPMQTFFFVERLAPYLTVPGQTQLFSHTGHTIHAERPRLLAEAITGFVDTF